MQEIELGPRDLMRFAREFREKEAEAGLSRPSLLSDVAAVLDRRRRDETVISAVQSGRIEPEEMTLEQQIIQLHGIVAAQGATIDGQGADLLRAYAQKDVLAAKLTKAHQRIAELELQGPLIGPGAVEFSCDGTPTQWRIVSACAVAALVGFLGMRFGWWG